MEPFSPRSLWHVGGFILGLSFQDKPLNVHPAQSFGREAFLLLSLCLIVFKEQYTDKEVEEEETSNQDEYDKEDHTLSIKFLLRPLTTFCNIERVDHDIGPTFKTGNDEERGHCVTNIVKVVIEYGPLTSGSEAFNFGMQ